MGMASANGIDADGTQTDYYGAAPESMLVDVRIGTDVGAGPFENYLLEQEFYELEQYFCGVKNKKLQQPGTAYFLKMEKKPLLWMY